MIYREMSNGKERYGRSFIRPGGVSIALQIGMIGDSCAQSQFGRYPIYRC